MKVKITTKPLKEAATIEQGKHYIIATGGDYGCQGMGDTSALYEVTDKSQIDFLQEYNQLQFMVDCSPVGSEEALKNYNNLKELFPAFRDLFPDYTKYHSRTSWDIIKL